MECPPCTHEQHINVDLPMGSATIAKAANPYIAIMGMKWDEIDFKVLEAKRLMGPKVHQDSFKLANFLEW